MSDYEILLKFIMIGDSNVGKSCMLLRLIEGRFKNQHEPTLGVEFGSRIFSVKQKSVKLQIWDTAGQQSFKSITRAYYKGSIGVLLIFDLTNQISFKNLKHWLHELKTHSHEKMRITLIGNKADLSSEREVSEEEINKFIAENGIKRYFQSSALNGQNIETPFVDMAENVLNAIVDGSIRPEQESAYGVKVKSSPSRRSYVKISQAADLQKKAEERCAC